MNEDWSPKGYKAFGMPMVTLPFLSGLLFYS